MKILITNSYMSTNLYIYYHYTGICNEATVTCSGNAFWTSNLSFDIIHIHWPESIVVYIEKEGGNSLNKLQNRLEYWKEKGAKLVITRHNYKPHYSNIMNQAYYEKLYDLLYSSVHAIVHHGYTSLNEFQAHSIYKLKINVCINHPNYLIGTPNKTSRDEARRLLRIEKDEVVFFSFGKIRSVEEEKMIVDAYNLLRIKKKGLIISNSLSFQQAFSPWELPAKLIHKIKCKIYNLTNIYAVEYDIANYEIQLFMNAADVVISPRINTLNSGVVFMGFSFGKVVIGADSGNVGEILKNTGNPVFNPHDVASIAAAMEEAYRLSKTDLGSINLEYVRTECDINLLGKKYIELYKSLCMAYSSRTL